MLIPYTITALERDVADADASGKQVVVGASCSMYIQPADTAINMYEDAAGSNPSTAKVTGTNGSVIVFVPAGDYIVKTNGISRYVSIGAEQFTTTQLIASLKIYEVGDIVTTSGYTTAGDGGSASWKRTATTGTASKSPAQLADGLLNDANGVQWELVVSTGVVYAAQLGCSADNSDNFSEITAAIAKAESDGIGIIELPNGLIKTSDEIVLNYEGLTLRGNGAGSFQDGTNRYKTNLQGTKTTKAVVRVMLESCTVEEMVISADATRQAAARDFTAAGYNCGLRVEADDVATATSEGDVFDTRLRNLHVTNQPNDGIIMIGKIYGSSHDRVICSNNGGHGVVVSNGEISNRTHVAIAGVLTIRDSTWDDNEGHGIRLGRKNATDYTVRVLLENCEGLYNGGDQSLLSELADSFYHCDSLTIINGAATGTDKARVDNTLAGYALMGTGGTILDARLLDCLTPFLLLGDATRRTESWNIISPHTRSSTNSYLAQITSGVANLYITCGDTTDTAITSATNLTGGVVGLTTIFQGAYLTTNAATWNSTAEFNGNVRLDADTDINGDFYIKSIGSATVESGGSLTINSGATAVDGYGLSIVPSKVNDIAIDSVTPVTLFDASDSTKMWTLHGKSQGNPVVTSFTAKVVGGSTPVVYGLVNQTGASVDVVLGVSGTDIEISTSAGTRNLVVYIKEEAIN